MGTHEVIVSGYGAEDEDATLVVSKNRREYPFTLSGPGIGSDIHLTNSSPVNDRKLTKRHVSLDRCDNYCIQGNKNLLEGQVSLESDKVRIYLILHEKSIDSKTTFNWNVIEK